MSQASTGDVVYCDPTYSVAHNNNGFIRYNERNFSWRDQERLAGACTRATDRGALVLVSNAVHAEIRKLYSHAEAHEVGRFSSLCPDPAMRRPTRELLFILRPR